jgi:hypothetical protein
MADTGFLFDLGFDASVERAGVPSGGGGAGTFGGPNVEMDVPAGHDVERYPESESARGLALKSFTLKESQEGWFSRLMERPDEVVIVSTSFDLSGDDPFVYPAKMSEMPPEGSISVRRGETHEWTLGDGFPVALPRKIVGGLAVGIHVAESDEGSVRIAEALIAASDAVKSDGELAALLKKLVANPGKWAADAVFGALTEASKVLGEALKKFQEEFDPIGLAAGQFSANGSWDGRLTQEWPEGKVVLVETK